MNDVEVVSVPKDESVVELVKQYADGTITYAELGQILRERGYSTLSLYENVRHIVPKKTPFNR